jgi:transcriptional regulator NrdR family protein
MTNDPEACDMCGRAGRVIESRLTLEGQRRRRHRCICGNVWATWQGRQNLTKVMRRFVTRIEQNTRVIKARA